MACSDMRRASACVSFSMPGPARTTRPPHAKALNSSCARPLLLCQHSFPMLYYIDGSNLIGANVYPSFGTLPRRGIHCAHLNRRIKADGSLLQKDVCRGQL